ncbi:MAG: hypothetical protein RIT07_174 [Bacteroidota bacterium]|jgi:hypothetical protein
MGCGKNAEKAVLQKGMPDLKAFFQNEVNKLTTMQPGLEKTIAVGEEVASFSADSLDWATELQPFMALDMSSAVYQNAFTANTDSNELLSISRYAAKDTTLEIQEISITRRNKNLEMMEIKTRKRSVWVNRDQVLSYLPGKGYNIMITEDYIWSSPKRTEIMGTFKLQQFKP